MSPSAPYTTPPDDALGLLESRSIARAYEAEDAARKAAPVQVVFSRVLEPGKHVLGLRGAVAAVRDALRAGRAQLGPDALAELLLARPAPQLFAALGDTVRGPTTAAALGLLECATVVGGFASADAAVKHADVELLSLRFRPGMGGRCLVVLGGQEDDTESAVFAATPLAEEHGGLVRASVITGPEAGTIAHALATS